MLAWDAQPSAKGQGDTSDIESSEYDLVVLGQPFWKKDVEVGPAVARVSRGDGCQGTAHAVESQDSYLAKDNGSEPRGERVLAEQRGDRDRNDARGEEGPDDGVHRLDEPQGTAVAARCWVWRHTKP